MALSDHREAILKAFTNALDTCIKTSSRFENLSPARFEAQLEVHYAEGFTLPVDCKVALKKGKAPKVKKSETAKSKKSDKPKAPMNPR